MLIRKRASANGTTNTNNENLLFSVICSRIGTCDMHFSFEPRLSQSPSLLISGSGSWPQREGRVPALSLTFAAENIGNLPLALRAREKL